MFTTISRPYVIAGQTITETAAATYKTLSPFAIATYKTLTSKKAQRIYRDAWTITSVAIQVAFWLAVLAGLYSIKAGRTFRAYCDAKLATATEAEATVEVSTDTAQPEIPAAVQTILESNVKTTKKLRAIATYFDIPWRNARGEGKHMLNADIRAALSAHPEILEALG